MPRTFETMGKELEKGEIALRLKRKEKEGRGGTENYVPRSREAYTRPPPSLETAHAEAVWVGSKLYWAYWLDYEDENPHF